MAATSNPIPILDTDADKNDFKVLGAFRGLGRDFVVSKVDDRNFDTHASVLWTTDGHSITARISGKGAANLTIQQRLAILRKQPVSMSQDDAPRYWAALAPYKHLDEGHVPLAKQSFDMRLIARVQQVQDLVESLGSKAIRAELKRKRALRPRVYVRDLEKDLDEYNTVATELLLGADWEPVIWSVVSMRSARELVADVAWCGAIMPMRV